MVAGTATKTDRNEAYSAEAARRLTEIIRSLTKPGAYGRGSIEFVVQDGKLQNLEVTVKEQVKI